MSKTDKNSFISMLWTIREKNMPLNEAKEAISTIKEKTLKSYLTQNGISEKDIPDNGKVIAGIVLSMAGVVAQTKKSDQAKTIGELLKGKLFKRLTPNI